MSTLSVQQPRIPASTAPGRDRLYRQVLALEAFQEIAASATQVAGAARQATRLDEAYLVLNEVLDVTETITVDLQLKVPGGTFTSILAAPVVFDAASPVGAQNPIALDPAFVAGGAPVPAGSVLEAIRTVANASNSPANLIVFELSPAT